jgi:hypothetical protein
MIFITIAACLLAMPAWISAAILASSPLGAPFLAKRMLMRGERTLAACCFGFFTAVINLLYIRACINPFYLALVGLCLGWAFFAILPSVVLGSAWASLATRTDAVPRRSPVQAWSVVLFLTIMPLATLWTLWPIRLLFFAARSTMERLADQAIAGTPLSGPRSVGLFPLAASQVDPPTGDVALLIDANPGHYSGFLRKGRGRPPAGSGRMFSGSNLSVHLGGDWWYNEDD